MRARSGDVKPDFVAIANLFERLEKGDLARRWAHIIGGRDGNWSSGDTEARDGADGQNQEQQLHLHKQLYPRFGR
jgi:hypothetical protein